MIIKEVFMKNFGKFHNERLRFQPGINIVCGGNESGKSTLYTFFQGIFFGLRRKRGVASRTDTYTRCLPWENPSWYEGSVLFEAGEKTFGWREILKAVLRRLSFIVLQTEKRCLWKKEIWKSFWEGLPSGYTKILQP